MLSRVCRAMIRNAKVHLEFNLARDVTYDKKGFFYTFLPFATSSKRKTRETWAHC